MITPEQKTFEHIRLIGIALPSKTTNKNGQSNIDIGNLWQKFEKEGIYSSIQGKLNNNVYAVYHEYEGDHMQPFSYFIGCKVEKGAKIPDGMDSLSISQGTYQKVIAQGEMPDCIGNAWKEIWASDIERAYQTDFEIYDERSQDWDDAEVDIFISVK